MRNHSILHEGVHEDVPPDALTDQVYTRIASLFPAPKHQGRPRTSNLRHVLEALLYKIRTGCPWRRLPPPPRCPPWPTVYGYYRVLVDAGLWPAIRLQLLKASSQDVELTVRRPPGRPHGEAVHDAQRVIQHAREAAKQAKQASEQARLTSATRKKFSKEAAERLLQIKRHSAECSDANRTST